VHNVDPGIVAKQSSGFCIDSDEVTKLARHDQHSRAEKENTETRKKFYHEMFHRQRNYSIQIQCRLIALNL